jgi:hypothetical protein
MHRRNAAPIPSEASGTVVALVTATDRCAEARTAATLAPRNDPNAAVPIAERVAARVALTALHGMEMG